MSGGETGIWVTLGLLGFFHGLNPAMGWLFAVALGLQDGRPRGVLRALPPIALGHAASVAAVVAAATAFSRVVPLAVVRWAGAAVLVTFGILMLLGRVRHRRTVGMRVGFRDLTAWSFLMSSAHGAGLMLLPVALHASAADAQAMRGGHATHMLALADAAPGGLSAGLGLAAVGVHAATMLATMAVIALLVYRFFGVGFLRRAWINLDLLWAAALVVAGVLTVAV